MTKGRKVNSKNGTAQNIIPDDQIKNIEIGRACGAYGGEDKCVQGNGGESEGKKPLGRIWIRMALLLLLVFSPWAGLGRDQSSVRRLVWLWYAASWASS